MEQLLSFAWALAVPVLGWLAKLWVNQVQKDLDDHKAKHAELEKALVDVKLTYVHKNDLREMKDEIFTRFDKFEEKLDKLHK